MQPQIVERNGHRIAIIQPGDVLLQSGQDALDFMAAIGYTAGANRIVLPAACLHPDFFDLKTKLAGEILQKAINYRFKLAIWGDFGEYTSPALHAFMAESNRGFDIFFCADQQAAIDALSR